MKTDEQKLTEKKKKLAESFDNIIAEYNRRSETYKKLDSIKEELSKLKGSNVSYQLICEVVHDVSGVKISPSSLGKYCVNELGFPKKKFKSSKKSNGKKRNKSNKTTIDIDKKPDTDKNEEGNALNKDDKTQTENTFKSVKEALSRTDIKFI